MPFAEPKYQLVGDICSKDPHYYQACDEKLGGKVTNGELLCAHYWCGWSDGISILSPSLANVGYICNGEFDCSNTKRDEEGCSEDMVILPNGEEISAELICDDNCDSWNKCEDEVLCNGYS